MSKPKKEYWLERDGMWYSIGNHIDMSDWNWHRLAVTKNPLRLKEGTRIKISITPTKTGFSVRAVGKAQKI